METLIQMNDGSETTLSEWTERDASVELVASPPISLAKERDKFLLWEVRRELAYTIDRILEHNPNLKRV